MDEQRREFDFDCPACGRTWRQMLRVRTCRTALGIRRLYFLPDGAPTQAPSTTSRTCADCATALRVAAPRR